MKDETSDIKPCLMVWEAGPEPIQFEGPITIEIKYRDALVLKFAVPMITLGQKLTGIGIR
jgi:hypothetical protein